MGVRFAPPQPMQDHILDEPMLVAFVQRVEKLRSSGVSLSEIARIFSISRTTLQSRLKRYKKLSEVFDDKSQREGRVPLK